MRTRFVFPVLLLLLFLLLTTSCQPSGQADLVAVGLPDLSGTIAFCRVDDNGDLIVQVQNTGDADAAASTVSVEFTPGGAVTAAVPAIAAGATADSAPIAFPAACYNPDCEFQITLDANGDVTESNEGNNTADGSCIG
ncbi:MAG: hypothetical protein JW910_07115 [Anaerolineae bacterium]|nr:hypothetical protein [Anaerolineae bacterium]